ncbi:hypothetical protein [Acanthamoeba polyphaga mimivirus]|uniref:Uncharacterized protein n=5 Tax=Megamimivirinae TaxID=3044648 RepID=A0A2L2DN45_MIMIV|nr:hypothetical protein MegaChil _gp0749 [Megavirus chiliensis]AFX92847.1 hypothetical protein CE11_00821 [Megavirus courdo11]AGD92696.1 hypothetical protein LBA_00778 [Megavirus lba]AUV58697.1 hypothetical protein [Bandra megavirus]AVG46471.1 hypothetical protein [Acanthamoeba polyphaga mimivirus]AVL94063.1 hypothetical protein mvi_703 [Megavirus vitis]
MSVRKRCVINDCSKNCGWKIVESDSEYVRSHKHHESPRSHCNDDHDHCHEVFDPCNRNNNRNFQRTLISVINPTNSILEIPIEFTNTFAARAIGVQQVIGNTVNISGWSDTLPDILDAFDNTTGIYTAPENGDYEFNLILNFKTSVPLTVNDAGTNIPIVEIYDVASGSTLAGGSILLPTSNIQITIPPIASGELPIEIEATNVLGSGQVVLTAIIPLVAGQQVRVRANSNGMVYNPIQEIIEPAFIDFNPNNSASRLTIQKVRNTPIIRYILN